MTRQDYRIAYRFLYMRAYKGGQQAIAVIEDLPNEQKEKIMKFLRVKHQVKFI